MRIMKMREKEFSYPHPWFLNHHDPEDAWQQVQSSYAYWRPFIGVIVDREWHQWFRDEFMALAKALQMDEAAALRELL